MGISKLASLFPILGVIFLSSPALAIEDGIEYPPKRVQICSDSKDFVGNVSKVNLRRCLNTADFPTIWHYSSTRQETSSVKKELIGCTSKNPKLRYFNVKPICQSHQDSNYYYRDVKLLELAPVIEGIPTYSRTSVDLNISIPGDNPDAPVKYFEVSIFSNNPTVKRMIERELTSNLTVDMLSPSTTYRFQVKAISIDSISPESLISKEVTTLPPAPARPLFSLSSYGETGTVNVALDGFSITQLGGPVESYSITPGLDPDSGLTFNSTTGEFGGIPLIAVTTTAYIVTGANESGSHSETFTLTVEDPIPGGPSSLSMLVFLLISTLWLGFFALRQRSVRSFA